MLSYLWASSLFLMVTPGEGHRSYFYYFIHYTIDKDSVLCTEGRDVETSNRKWRHIEASVVS